jgi:hypothetical protein
MSSFEGILSILQPTEEATRDFLVEVEDAETQVSRTLSVKLIDLIHTESLHFVCKIKYMNSISLDFGKFLKAKSWAPCMLLLLIDFVALQKFQRDKTTWKTKIKEPGKELHINFAILLQQSSSSVR